MVHLVQEVLEVIEDMPVRDWKRAQTAQEKPELQNDIDKGHRRKRRLKVGGGEGKKNNPGIIKQKHWIQVIKNYNPSTS